MPKSSSVLLPCNKEKTGKKCPNRGRRAKSNGSSRNKTVPMLAVKRNSRKDRRKRVTIVVKPPFTLPKKHQRSTPTVEEVRRFDRDKCPSSRATCRTKGTDSKTGSLEEKREVHRVHERQRHRSLNEALKELVKILPPGDSYKSVTKYNVLRTANDYMDFLQNKITRLCLERSIEHTTQDGKLSFDIPLNTVVGGEELDIPATAPVSPKMLQSVHKAAKDLSVDLIAKRGPTECDGRTPPRRFCRSSLTKKSPELTAKASNAVPRGTNSGAMILEIAFDEPILPPCTSHQTCKTLTDFEDGELVVDETPSQLVSPTGTTPTDPGQGDVVVDEAPPLKGSDASEIASQPTELPEPGQSSNCSDKQDYPEENSWPRKVGSSPNPTSLHRKAQVKLLDHYIHADVAPHQEYTLPQATPSFPYQLHSEHSYSSKVLPVYTACGVSDDSAPPTIPCASAFPSSLESSQLLPSQNRSGSSADIIPCILSSSLYIQQPVSFPLKMVSCESTVIPTTLVHRSSLGATRPIPSTVSPMASKSTTRYTPIQPAAGTSNDVVVKTLLNLYGQSSVVQNKQPIVPDISAQKLVVDPSLLKFEDSDSAVDGACDSEQQQQQQQQHAVMTPAAGSGCSMRRSWINGYQLFTKVNHPRFRDKWPRLQGREITRLLSQTWKELPTDSKKQYSSRARQWNQWHRCKRESASHVSTEI